MSRSKPRGKWWEIPMSEGPSAPMQGCWKGPCTDRDERIAKLEEQLATSQASATALLAMVKAYLRPLPCPKCGSKDLSILCKQQITYTMRCSGCGIELRGYTRIEALVGTWNVRVGDAQEQGEPDAG